MWIHVSSVYLTRFIDKKDAGIKCVLDKIKTFSSDKKCLLNECVEAVRDIVIQVGSHNNKPADSAVIQIEKTLLSLVNKQHTF